MGRKNKFKVEFSVDDITLAEQDRIFKVLIDTLDYNQRQKLNITVTDPMGGKHYIWDDKGIDPNGVKCSNCKSVDCRGCMIYSAREEMKNG